jgi:hypothetical protein
MFIYSCSQRLQMVRYRNERESGLSREPEEDALKNISSTAIAIASFIAIFGAGVGAITPEYPPSGWTAMLDANGQIASLSYTVPASTADIESVLVVQMDGKITPVGGVFTYRDGVKRTANPPELKIYWAMYGGPHFIWDYLGGQGKTVSVQASVSGVPQEFLGQPVRLFTANGREYFGTLTRMQLGPDWLWLDINGTPVSYYVPNVREIQRLK